MRLRVKYGCWWLPPWILAIVLYPFVLFKPKKDDVWESLAKHEMVHVRDIRLVSAVSFYLSYVMYYFAGLIRYMDHEMAYIDNPWERRAMEAQERPLDEYEREELGL